MTARTMTSTQRRLWGAGFAIGLVLVWELAARLVQRTYLLPGPTDVLRSLWENRGEIFLVHFPATAEVMILGCLLAVLLGFAFAAVMDASPLVYRALDPILTVSQTIPTVCLAPVLVLWFGYTVKMRVFVVVLVNFFAVTVNLTEGFRSADPLKQELMRSWGAPGYKVFTQLKMPSALPHFFTALKVAIPWSAVGAAVSEWLGAPSGLGTYSRTCMTNMNAAGLLAPLVVLTAWALALTAVAGVLEKRVLARRG